jgi:hypothetical protein
MHLRSFDFTLLAALATSLAAANASHAAGVVPPPAIASTTLGQPGGPAQLGTDGTLLLVPRATLGGTMTFSGADTAANHGLYANHAVSGTSTTPNAAVYEFNVLTDTASTTNYFNGLTLNYTMGTAGGGRGGIDVQFGITQQPTTSVGAANYVGALQVGAATVNVGGTATTPAGGLFGNNPNVRLANNATYWTMVNAQENDVSMLVGTSATSVFGQSIVHGQNTVVHGSIDDAALAFADQDNVSARWLYGIAFGTHQAQWPLDPGGTMIGAIARTVGPLVAPVQALNGVDFRAVAFQSGGEAFASQGFAVDPVGNISASSLVTPTITNTGSVTAMTVSGGGYTPANVLPTVTVAAPASGAAASAAVTHLGWIGDGVASLTNAGAGCSVGDHLTAVGATGTGFGINVTAIGTGGTVTAYTPGGAGDTTAPYPAASVTLSGGKCTAAPVMAAHLYISQLGVTAGGSGYTTAPAVTVSAGATATAAINTSQTLAAAGGQVVLSSTGTQLGVAGTAGKPVIDIAAQADQAYVRIVAVSGGSSSFAANVSEHFLDPAAAISSYADTLPATPVDGQTADISCGQTVTTLTVNAARGQTLRPSGSSVATSCSGTQGHRWKYRAGQSAWNQIY